MEFYFLSGRDTLRCLALATVDEPPLLQDMDLSESDNFIRYEVSIKLFFQTKVYALYANMHH